MVLAQKTAIKSMLLTVAVHMINGKILMPLQILYVQNVGWAVIDVGRDIKLHAQSVKLVGI